MKKILLLLLTASICSVSFGQRKVVDGQMKGICTDPAVSLTANNVGETSYTVEFTPNAECDHYYYLTMADAEISMWTMMMGMTIDQLITQWGIQTSSPETYTWTEQAPNTLYRIFALPFDADGNSYTYSSIDVTTSAIGGNGTAVVSVDVTDITATSALVTCTPNDQTALFYDGLVTAEFLGEVGADSVCTILIENSAYPFYETYTWNWIDLLSNTDYYAIAFGQNADGEWGDTTMFIFATLEGVGIRDMSEQPIIVYPMPNNGNFTVAGSALDNFKAQIFAINGQLIGECTFSSGKVNINGITSGSYLLRVVNSDNQCVGTKKIVVK